MLSKNSVSMYRFGKFSFMKHLHLKIYPISYNWSLSITSENRKGWNEKIKTGRLKCEVAVISHVVSCLILVVFLWSCLCGSTQG